MHTPAFALTRRDLLRTATITGALLSWPALLGCATPTTPAAARPLIDALAGSTPVVMLIRHAEKPERSAPAAGIDLLGHSDGHSLTRQGWTRAAYLPDLFTPTTGIDLPGAAALPQPRTIYASGAGSADGEGTRSRETVGPLAAALGLPVDTSFSRGQEVELARQAATAPGPVLICWQHDAIPAIAAAFAPDPAPPTTWPADRYDLIWLLTNTSTGWRLQQVPQLLLPDDATAEVR